ncbi:LysR family transcriptional regulator [Kutzneria viridogrisea]|uniref:HTH lysR-type domain-containing protein n=2 Tax=Kutzneria TaxID=43356 RepID=W5WP89_9PSEU|nr:LysR family transcriptional regulator [Kutzneria albida]AHH99999.1 hypothetical protein KALB_6640 [Kutzneria albida DSM 43870]MBA8925179.1 DNA-binding transcriptional LysR family regulator [Kutzneria viridogrisea]
MSLNPSQLRAFLAVLDSGGFGAGADSIGVSQSAVSHSVAALERVLGHPVLVRGGTPRPTAFGAALVEHARAAVSAMAAITDLAAQHSGQPTGVVRLGAPPSVCQGLLPDLLERWRLALPRVEVRVFEGEDDEVSDWLAGGSLEAAVLVDPKRTGGVLVGADSFQALLRADHPLAEVAELGLAELADDPFLLSVGGCERHIRRVHRRAKVEFAPTHRVRELGTLLAMVRSGVGVSVVPGLVAAMLEPGLVLVPLREGVSRRLVFTGPADRAWHPAVTAMAAEIGSPGE